MKYPSLDIILYLFVNVNILFVKSISTIHII